MTHVKTCLWYDGDGEQAARFYTSIIKDSAIGEIGRYTEAGPGEPGTAMAVEFTLGTQQFVALNGGPQFPHTEAASIQVYCEDQAEVDAYWNALTEGGEESMCGWLKDRFGLSWQIIPKELMALVSDPDPGRALRATQAMFTMRRLDLAAIREAAAAG